jgi:hypothetical protein
MMLLHACSIVLSLGLLAAPFAVEAQQWPKSLE